MVLLRSFLQVTLITVGISYLLYLGYFSSVYVELGLEHYAEKSQMELYIPLFSPLLKMPINCIICFGYVIVGMYWLAQVNFLEEIPQFTFSDTYVLAIFNWMAVLYGPIQCLRLVIQLHPFAVLDQWVTLPFFAWVIVWSKTVDSHPEVTFPRVFSIAVVGLSLASYSLAYFHRYGFEVSLGLHVFMAFIFGLRSYRKNPNSDSKWCIVKATLSCMGFVILKLLDLPLGEIHPFFTIISGHFLSKICDILQVYYVNLFFFNIIINRQLDSKKKKL